MVITKEDILMGRQTWDQVAADVQKNILILVERINKLLAAYAKSGRTYVTKINDGLRRLIDQPPGAAPHSTHLIGCAIDLDDNDAGDFWAWVKDNFQLLKDIGLWIEHPCWTHYYDTTTKTWKSWMHFQIVAPGSGNRAFVPNTNPNPNPKFWDGKYDAKFNGK